MNDHTTNHARLDFDTLRGALRMAGVTPKELSGDRMYQVLPRAVEILNAGLNPIVQDLTGFKPGDKVLYRGEVRIVTRPFDGTEPFLTLEKNGANKAVDVREVKPATIGVGYGEPGEKP